MTPVTLWPQLHYGPSYTIPDCYRSAVLFTSYCGSSYTASDIQRFDNHCESHSALEVVYNAPIAIRYSVTGPNTDKAHTHYQMFLQMLKAVFPKHLRLLYVVVPYNILFLSSVSTDGIHKCTDDQNAMKYKH